MNHIVWEDDESESLCGLDMENRVWVEDYISCRKCREVEGFLHVVEAFASNHSMRDSLTAAFQVWRWFE